MNKARILGTPAPNRNKSNSICILARTYGNPVIIELTTVNQSTVSLKKMTDSTKQSLFPVTIFSVLQENHYMNKDKRPRDIIGWDGV